MARLLKNNPLKPDPPNLQERVIQRDREESGREAPEENATIKQSGVNEGVLTGVSEPVSTESSNPESEDWRESVIERARELGSKRKLPQTRFNADIDEELHKQLRLHCIEKGLSLKQFLPALLEEYLKGVKRQQ